MDELEYLYNTMAYLTAKGIPFSDEQKKAVEEAEDEYIASNVLPIVKQTAGGVMGKLQCPMEVVISYLPGEEIKVVHHRLEEQQEQVEKARSEEDTALDKVGESIGATANEEQQERRQKRKSIGFSVSFADGDVIHRKKAVDTWKDALKKIGLSVIFDNRKKHEAWHTVGERDVCIVEREEVTRGTDGESPQDFEDGFYIMTQLSNTQKVKDLKTLGRFMPQLGISVKWDDQEAFEAEDSSDEMTDREESPDKWLVRSRVANGFALDVVKQLYNLDKLDSVKPCFVRNSLMAVEKNGQFKLIGMFIRCTREELDYRNARSTSTRWFDTPFEVDGETMFLSNQWVDKPFGALRISDLQKMVDTCYHGLLEVELLGNGLYVLKEK